MLLDPYPAAGEMDLRSTRIALLLSWNPSDDNIQFILQTHFQADIGFSIAIFPGKIFCTDDICINASIVGRCAGATKRHASCTIIIE